MKISKTIREIWDEWVYENGSYKLVALFITMILWDSVLGRKETTIAKEIPLVFVTATDRVLTSTSAHSVRYELTGSRRALKRFAADRVEPITIDLSGASGGVAPNSPVGRMIVSIPDDTLKLPFGVKVVSVNPPSLVVELDVLTKKRVPIMLDWRDSRVEGPRPVVEPKEAVLEGSRAALSKISEVYTVELISADAEGKPGQRVMHTKVKWPDIEGLKPSPDLDVMIRY